MDIIQANGLPKVTDDTQNRFGVKLGGMGSQDNSDTQILEKIGGFLHQTLGGDLVTSLMERSWSFHIPGLEKTGIFHRIKKHDLSFTQPDEGKQMVFDFWKTRNP